MNIVLTYDPRWKYTPKDHTPFWASLDTVDFVAEMLTDTGHEITLIKADNSLETNLLEIKNEQPESLIFWLNEFMPTDSGKDIFTVGVIEKTKMMHTGHGSEALGIGLNKEATKDVFRTLGLPTPESYVVYLGDYSPISQHNHWNSYVMIKPLLQGGSKGIDELSVVRSDDTDSIKEKVERIHYEFNGPTLIERYIGGKYAKEYSVPMLISSYRDVADLPIVEIDLSRIPPSQGNINILTREIKLVGGYQNIPAELPPEISRRLYSDIRRIIEVVGCRDFTRVDMRGNSTGLYYIEINVNPDKDMLDSSLIMSGHSLGLEYSEMVALIPYQAMVKYGLDPSRKLEDLVRPVIALFETRFALEVERP